MPQAHTDIIFLFSFPKVLSNQVMMSNFACFGKKLHHLCSCSFLKVAFLSQSMGFLLLCYYRFLLLRAKQFWVELVYFVTLSFLGYWVLKVLPVRTTESFTPRNLDLFFTSVSATTVSSMSTVEMEVFSNGQLIVMTILMFIGGEVFTSMVGLHFKKFKLMMMMSTKEKIASVNSSSSSSPARAIDENIELGLAIKPEFPHDQTDQISAVLDDQSLKLQKSIELLGYVVLAYLLVVHFLGVAMVLVYLAFTSSARNIVENKGLNVHTFSFFTTVSTFSSCGFVPTNENMIVFSKNSGLLLILIPQVLLGNTLYPSCLRYTVWLLGKVFKKQRDSCNYLLKNTKEVGYLHLLPSLHSSLLVVTVFGFILVQFVPFASMEWSSESLSGLNSYQKIIGSLFQTVNSRHTGETIVDLSIISPAILVLFIVMMYLPPYTSFLPARENDEYDLKPHDHRRKDRRGKLMENLIFSQLSYLTIFIILVCITERKSLKEDPLNFNVLNIVLEVISAYGNVGFTTGYSCKRQLNPNGDCQDKWYGFSGRWSDEGKIVLIAVMYFGRLKKFNMDGGKGWKLL